MSDPASLIYTPEQVRELDRVAIEELGIPGYELMTRAGKAVFDAVRARFPRAQRWLVVCGAGNNAGDGYVVARLAQAAGSRVTVAALSDPGQLTGDALHAWQDYQRGGGAVVEFTGSLCSGADVVIDALLGTGLGRPIEGAWRQAVEAVNGAAMPVVAVDIPTGLDATSGCTQGAAIKARLTVTFIGRKLGLYVGAGPDHAGEISFSDLGVPDGRIRSVSPAARLFDVADHARLLTRRARTAHKGDFGHVLVIGGNSGMGGSVALAGEAALRAGAGLVTVATRPDNVAAVTGSRPELMCRGLSGAADLEPLLGRASVIAIGPGLGQDDWARGLLEKAFAAPQPLVADADALNLLAGNPRRRDEWILTPHPGEAGRLLGVTTAEVQADRMLALDRLCTRFGGVALLKGRCTVAGESGGLPFVIDGGNPGMATAGMGDVLTGLIAGLLAQFRPAGLLTVAACAAFIHARAGDDAAGGGERGLMAGDLLPRFRAWLNPVR